MRSEFQGANAKKVQLGKKAEAQAQAQAAAQAKAHESELNDLKTEISELKTANTGKHLQAAKKNDAAAAATINTLNQQISLQIGGCNRRQN